MHGSESDLEKGTPLALTQPANLASNQPAVAVHRPRPWIRIGYCRSHVATHAMWAAEDHAPQSTPPRRTPSPGLKLSPEQMQSEWGRSQVRENSPQQAGEGGGRRTSSPESSAAAAALGAATTTSFSSSSSPSSARHSPSPRSRLPGSPETIAARLLPGQPDSPEQRRLKQEHAVWLRAARGQRELRVQATFVCAMTVVGIVFLNYVSERVSEGLAAGTG